jgi:hypothetical protein
MARPKVRDEFRLHPVVIALSRARAASVLLKVLNDGDDYLQIPVRLTADEETETREWLVDIAEDALGDALAEAEAEFRTSLTPEQALAQVIGPHRGAKAEITVEPTGGA